MSSGFIIMSIHVNLYNLRLFKSPVSWETFRTLVYCHIQDIMGPYSTHMTPKCLLEELVNPRGFRQLDVPNL